MYLIYIYACIKFRNSIYKTERFHRLFLLMMHCQFLPAFTHWTQIVTPATCRVTELEARPRELIATQMKLES